MFTLTNTASSPITSSALTLSTLIAAPKIFTKYQNLVLETADLTAGSHIITHIAKIV